MGKIRNWFGDTSDEESSEESEKEDESWTEVKRKEKSKIRKQKADRKKKDIKKKVTLKAKHIVGIGPILPKSLNYHMKKSKDNNAAKMNAVIEFLKHHLKYDDTEIEALTIRETQLSAKADRVIYLAFEDLKDIKDLHSRIAEVQNREVQTQNFIPPQYYERYMTLSKLCADKRHEDSKLKTLMRFNHDDVEILMKTKGTEEPYQIVPIEELIDLADLPEFDHSKVWHCKLDKPPRRKVSNSPVRGTLESTTGIQPNSRQSSTNSTKLPAKRSRNNES